jgi:hypothetical protein
MRIRNQGGKNLDPGSEMEKIRIRDPEWEEFGSGIRDKRTGSATLLLMNGFLSSDGTS